MGLVCSWKRNSSRWRYYLLTKTQLLICVTNSTRVSLFLDSMSVFTDSCRIICLSLFPLKSSMLRFITVSEADRARPSDSTRYVSFSLKTFASIVKRPPPKRWYRLIGTSNGNCSESKFVKNATSLSMATKLVLSDKTDSSSEKREGLKTKEQLISSQSFWDSEARKSFFSMIAASSFKREHFRIGERVLLVQPLSAERSFRGISVMMVDVLLARVQQRLSMSLVMQGKCGKCWSTGPISTCSLALRIRLHSSSRRSWEDVSVLGAIGLKEALQILWSMFQLFQLLLLKGSTRPLAGREGGDLCDVV